MLQSSRAAAGTGPPPGRRYRGRRAASLPGFHLEGRKTKMIIRFATRFDMFFNSVCSHPSEHIIILQLQLVNTFDSDDC